MSLRSYLTLTDVNELLNSEYTSDQFNSVIEKCESDIDSAMAVFVQGPWSKADKRTLRFSASFTSTTTATLSAQYTLQDDVQYMIVKVLSGALVGTRRLIKSNTGNSITFDEIAEATGTAEVLVYQLGKAPFLVDSDAKAKWINDDIRQAVAYQVEYILETQKKKVRTKGKKKSESIGANYSYTLEDTGWLVTQGVDIAPKAMSILGKYSVNMID